MTNKIFFLLAFLVCGHAFAQASDTIRLGYLDSNGLRQGIWSYTDSSTMEVFDYKYENDTLNGITRITHFSDVKELNYFKGKLNGVSREYSKGKLIEQQHYINDTLTRIIKYNRKGMVTEDCEYYGDYKNGTCVYYIKGRISFLEELQNGKSNGLTIWYHKKTANPSTIGYYKDGEKIGVWTSYDKKGRIISQTNFDTN